MDIVDRVYSVIPIQNIKCDTDLTEFENEQPLDISEVVGRTYGTPDPEVGEHLKKLNLTTINPEEIGSYFEGDILKPAVRGRNGMLDEVYRWPDGTVPYEIRGSFSKNDLNLISSAFNEYHKQTCIRFVPKSNEKDYIVFQNGNTGCWSSVGRVGNGAQVINLQTPGCVVKIGTVLHEIMHALGFLHEQNREDRDSYVSVDWNNVKKAAYNNFERATPQTTTAFGVSYDTGSVLHYSSNAFAIDPSKPTIIPKDPQALKVMGQRENFSAADVKKIWKMYKCKSPTASGQKTNNNLHALEAIGGIISNVFKIGDEEELVE
ncbi:hatching enzyme 1.2-like [Condylostylus longicornis]|uniref:hatching enzyme 1.2-like n=1 Tax=Condylostylus longicornis TaxID=2530218 RepID=UPI00244DA52D|nr:hatching enzyme 1.2-like [Condylostylus longicornis]